MNEEKEVHANSSPLNKDHIPEEISHGTGILEDILAKYLIDFAIDGDTVIGYINEFDTFKEIVEKMKIQGFAFSVRDSDIREKQRGKIKKNTYLSENGNVKTEQVPPNLTIFFQLRAMPIKFFGLPFTIEKTTHYQCAYGCKYYKSKAGSSQKKVQDDAIETKPVRKKKRVGSKKMGCLAKMTIKHITVYPEYELYVESDWRKKKMLIENLRKDLSDMEKTVERIQRFYLSVSVQSSHNHPPIIIVPKTKVQKRKSRNLLVKSNRLKKLINSENIQHDVFNEEGGTWCCEEMGTSSVSHEEERRENTSSKIVSLQDENFFHTLVKFPSSHTAVYEQVEYKPNKLEMEMNAYDQNDGTQTIEVYEYQPTVQDLQVLFKEKLKRLYTLCTACSNGSLLLRLAIDLEQIELQLNGDISYTNV